MIKPLFFISKTFILSCIVGILFFSCVKKDFDFNNLADQQLTPEIAIPLINSSFTIKDLLLETDKNGNISIDPTTNFCTLVYKGNLFSVKGTDLVNLTNQNYSSNYSLTSTDVTAVNALPAGASYTISYLNPINYTTSNSVLIDELTFKTGFLALRVNSLLKQKAVLRLSIPSAVKNGIPLTQTVSVGASSGSTVSSLVTIDLTGYTFDMTKGGTTNNQFDVNYSIILTKTANNSSVGETFSITQSLTNQAFDLIKGDIGQQSLSANIDTVAISIFKNSVPGGGDFRINYANVKFIIENSYGVPIRINNLTLAPYGLGQSFPSPIVPLPAYYNSFDINAPTVIGTSAYTYPPQIGGPTETTLNNIINAKPKNFIYNVMSTSNPNGAPALGSRNFITDQSQFKVDLELSIPLDGGAWDFLFADTMKFDLSGNTLDNVNNLMLRNYVNNGFPFDVGMNIDFVDSLYAVKETLNPGAPYSDVISSANIDANGIVTSSVQKTTDFTLTRAQLDNLKNVKYIILRAKGKTTNNGIPNVKIYANYKCDVKMGIKGEFNFSINQK
jgi:hypothetical protein